MWGRALVAGGTSVADTLQTQMMYQRKVSWCFLTNLGNGSLTPNSVRPLSTLPRNCERKSAGICNSRVIQRLVGIQCIDNCIKTTGVRSSHCSSIFSRAAYTRARQNSGQRTGSFKGLGSSVSFSADKCPKYSNENNVLLPTGMQSSVRHLSENRGGLPTFALHTVNKHLKLGTESCSALPTGMHSSVRYISREKGGFNGVHSRVSALQLKKRSQRKKKQIQDDSEEVRL